MGLLDDTWNCTKEQFGLPGLSGLSMFMANGPFPKDMLGVRRGLGGASDWTTALSKLALDRPDLDIRSPMLRPLLGSPSLLRTVGRAVPIVSGGLLAYDLLKIANCVNEKYHEADGLA